MFQNNNKKKVFICVSTIIILCIVIQFFFWPVRRFAREPRSFHEELANTCLTLLDNTDLTTNRIVRLDPSLASLPAALMRYKPKRIVISKDRVWMFFGEGRLAGFGVALERNNNSSDIWKLKSFDGVNEKIILQMNK